MASLVVCLPVAHAGGALRVEHGRRSVTYEWGAGAADGEVQVGALLRLKYQRFMKEGNATVASVHLIPFGGAPAALFYTATLAWLYHTHAGCPVC